MRRFPRLAEGLPWMDLGGLPTPITPARELGSHIGIPGLYIKRDDVAGAEYGGSKARKLEHLVADALDRGQRDILTFGGVGSNHALATAVHTHRLGLGCILLLLPERPSQHAREHLLAEHHLGCEQYRASSTDDRAVDQVLARRGSGVPTPYVIPAGGTSPLGNVGYVNAAFELAEQCAAGLMPVPDELYVAAGTLGTAAGLYVGLRAAGLPTRLVSVRASNPGTGSLRNLRAQIESTSRFLRERDPDFPDVEIVEALLHHERGFTGEGYAIPSSAGRHAQETAHEHGGIELDPTYTAKAFAALISRAPRHAERIVLFWNTFDPRHVGSGTVGAGDLPPEFRGYLR